MTNKGRLPPFESLGWILLLAFATWGIILLGVYILASYLGW